MGEYNSIKLGGLFRTKRQGMYVGNIKPDTLEELQALMNSKKAQRNGVVLFMFKNDRDNGPVFNLLADAAKPREDRRDIEDDDRPKKKRIYRDEEDEEGEEVADEEPPKKHKPAYEDEEEEEEVKEEEVEERPKKKIKKTVRRERDDDRGEPPSLVKHGNDDF